MQLRCSRRVQFGPLSLSASLRVKAPRRLLDAATSEPGGRDWKLNVHFERRASHDLSQGILGCTHRHYAESRKTAMEELPMVRWLSTHSATRAARPQALNRRRGCPIYGTRLRSPAV
jgi:hypothetical protein